MVGFHREELVRGLITKSPDETKKLGEEIANRLTAGHRGSTATILALSGNLGSGKTTFVQGFARGLGISGRIISPTFILMRCYQISGVTSHKSQVTGFYHVDLYRLENEMEKEVVNLGLTDIWGRGENVVVIEWAEKIEEMLPKNSRRIKFENLGKEKRRIIFS